MDKGILFTVHHKPFIPILLKSKNVLHMLISKFPFQYKKFESFHYFLNTLNAEVHDQQGIIKTIILFSKPECRLTQSNRLSLQ